MIKSTLCVSLIPAIMLCSLNAERKEICICGWERLESDPLLSSISRIVSINEKIMRKIRV